MEVRIQELIEGARKAEGLTVIIDVFRAFSLEGYLFSRGAAQCIPIGDINEAFKLKKAHEDYILIGERGGAKVEGCDFGNSPSQTEGADLEGKTIIHTTSAGTQGIVNAQASADEIMVASLVNARAVAQYIRSRAPKVVTIVAMGKAGLETAYEDVLCAEYIRYLLQECHDTLDDHFEIQKKADALKETAGKHFFDPDNQETFPERDFYLCTRCNIFDFVITVGKDGVNIKRDV